MRRSETIPRCHRQTSTAFDSMNDQSKAMVYDQTGPAGVAPASGQSQRQRDAFALRTASTETHRGLQLNERAVNRHRKRTPTSRFSLQQPACVKSAVDPHWCQPVRYRPALPPSMRLYRRHLHSTNHSGRPRRFRKSTDTSRLVAG